MQVANKKNINEAEQVVSLVMSGVLGVQALRRQGWLGALLGVGSSALLYRGLSGNCPAYRWMGIGTSDDAVRKGVKLRQSITIAAPMNEVYSMLRNTAPLAPVLSELARLDENDGGNVTWHFEHGPIHIDTRTEIITGESENNNHLTWKSLDGEALAFRCDIHLQQAPGKRGTEVHAEVHCAPSKLRPMIVVLQALRQVGQVMLSNDLHRLKQRIETGEIATNATQTEERSAEESTRQLLVTTVSGYSSGVRDANESSDLQPTVFAKPMEVRL